MSPEVTAYVNLGLTALLIIVYWVVAVGQKNVIKGLQTTIGTQTELLTNVTKVLEVYDLDKLKKWSDLSVETAVREVSMKHAEETAKMKIDFNVTIDKLQKQSSTTSTTTTHKEPVKITKGDTTVKDLLIKTNETMDIITARMKEMREVEIVAVRETVDKFPNNEMKAKRDAYLKARYPNAWETMVKLADSTISLLERTTL